MIRYTKYIILLLILISLYLVTYFTFISYSEPDLIEITFKFNYPAGHKVYITADFNCWDVKKDEMQYDSIKKHYYITKKVYPGKYKYCFYIDGKYYADPENEDYIISEFGLKKSIITIGNKSQIDVSVRFQRKKMIEKAKKLSYKTKQISQLDKIAKLKKPLKIGIISNIQSDYLFYKKFLVNMLKEKPDFIINLGNIVNYYKNFEQWEKFADITLNSGIPHLIIPGCYDIPDSESIYSFLTLFDVPDIRVTSTFKIDNLNFFFLNSEVPEKKGEFSWSAWFELESKLKLKNSNDIFLLFSHRPPLKTVQKLNDTHSLKSSTTQRLHKLLLKYNINYFFSGHSNIYSKKIIDKVNYICFGNKIKYNDMRNAGRYYYYIMNIDEHNRISLDISN